MRKPILIVDDSEDTREMFKAALEVEGYPVKMARDGQEALALLEKHEFSLMLLDIRMPNMSGEEVIHEMRARKLAGSLRILLVSAVDDVGDLRYLPQVIDTLKKPFFYPELLYKIKQLEKDTHPPEPSL